MLLHIDQAFGKALDVSTYVIELEATSEFYYYLYELHSISRHWIKLEFWMSLESVYRDV